MDSCRGYRLYPHEYAMDNAKTGNMRFSDGQIRPGIDVKDQILSIDFAKVYPDDAMAIIRDMYMALNKARPDEYNEKIIGRLTEAIYDADRRAVAKHGYSWSPNERDLPTPQGY